MKASVGLPRSALLVGVLLAATLFQTGCMTRFMHRARTPVAVEVDSELATVVFLRPSWYGAKARFFVVDGNGAYLGDVQGVEYFVRRFEPGRHDFIAWAENEDMIQAELAPGRLYYVLLSVRMGFWTAAMSISTLTPDRAEWENLSKWMGSVRQLEPDDQLARQWQEQKKAAIESRIADARQAWAGMDDEARALRTLDPFDGFSEPQH